MRDLGLDKIKKGALILVRWLDASDLRCGLNEHESNPEVHCKDWGVYLGCSGRKHKMVIIGKDVVEVHNDWGATRIPVELVEGVTEVLPRSEMIKHVREIGVIGRRLSIRKYERNGESIERVSSGT